MGIPEGIKVKILLINEILNKECMAEGYAKANEEPDGERRRVRYRNCAAKLDGRYPHWVGPFCGTRYSVIFFKLYDRNLEVCLRLCMLQVETLPFAWSFRRAASADEWL